MPSPALERLDKAPTTPLSSRPTSPTGSEKDSHEVPQPASQASAARDRRRSSHGSSSYAGGAGSSLGALTAIRNIAKQHQAHKDSVAQDDNGEIEEAAEEEDMGLLRTGNQRLRRGSTKLRRQSSTLGAGVTAYWQPSRDTSRSNSTVMTPLTKTPANEKADQASRTASNPVHAPALAEALAEHSQTTSSPEKLSGQKSSPAAPATPAPVPVPVERAFNAVNDEEELSPIEKAKRLAAYRAVDVHIKPHHRVLGIGSGSTVPYVVDRILELGPEANKDRWVRLL